MAELQGLQLRHDDFAGRGAEILAVVVDPEMKVIDVYGLRHSGGHEGEDIARPATFLIDEKGVVVWRNLAENIRKRPHPEEILAEIDRMRG
jgi:peroxiredoxin